MERVEIIYCPRVLVSTLRGRFDYVMLRFCGLLPQRYRLKRAQILLRAFPPTAHVSLLFLTIFTKLVYFSYPSTLGDFGLFQDVLRILSVGYISAY